MASLLVLWDVDGTLVNVNGAGRRLYELAFSEVFGTDLPPSAHSASMAGRTDRAIAIDVLTRAGVPDPRGQVIRFEAALARLAPGICDLVVANGQVLPGVRAALAALAGLAIRQSVLTGNGRALAVAKLAPLDLTRHLDLAIGAYGDEHEVRAKLVNLARTRASAAHGCDYQGTDTVLIGDTPLDVEAALAADARAIAVATGMFSAEQLAAAGAHAVLPDLTDTGRLLAALSGL